MLSADLYHSVEKNNAMTIDDAEKEMMTMMVMVMKSKTVRQASIRTSFNEL